MKGRKRSKNEECEKSVKKEKKMKKNQVTRREIKKRTFTTKAKDAGDLEGMKEKKDN